MGDFTNRASRLCDISRQLEIAGAGVVQGAILVNSETGIGENLHGIAQNLPAEYRQALFKNNRFHRQVNPVDCPVLQEPIVHSGATKDQPSCQWMSLVNLSFQVIWRQNFGVQPQLGFAVPALF